MSMEVTASASSPSARSQKDQKVGMVSTTTKGIDLSRSGAAASDAAESPQPDRRRPSARALPSTPQELGRAGRGDAHVDSSSLPDRDQAAADIFLIVDQDLVGYPFADGPHECCGQVGGLRPREPVPAGDDLEKAGREANFARSRRAPSRPPTACETSRCRQDRSGVEDGAEAFAGSFEVSLHGRVPKRSAESLGDGVE